MQNKKRMTFSEAINQGLKISMKKDKRMIFYGLGSTDPKSIFGTSKNLKKLYGSERVFDVPCSENALTGVAIGASLAGVRSVVTHQRLDFFLLAMDQLVNSAAKWHYMFGGQISVPITIRLIVGRGWGQGPTHSQNLHAWFAHIPGLKVVIPTYPEDAKNLLIKSIFDPNPVIFIEHRWLHSQVGQVTNKFDWKSVEKCKLIKKGRNLTVVGMSYLTIEASRAQKIMKENFNIELEILDLRYASPIDYASIEKSVKKTKRLLVLDTGFKTCSVSSEIAANINEKLYKILKSPVKRLAMPDIPEPTSYALTKNFYINYERIILESLKILNINYDSKFKLVMKKYKQQDLSHDQPHKEFFGPF
jgi:pyruvate dehydrogenase E1 component beta subunit